MKTLLFGLCCLPIFAADLLPLAQGNQWIYRISDGSSRTISVGLPLSASGRIYYRVSGYAVQPLWLRSDDNAVYFFDEETATDRELVRFVAGPLRTPISGCEQSAEAQRDRTPYAGPVGRFPSALEVRFQSLACRDVGFDTDSYVDNIGLVRRVETSIAGPRTLELVYAKVGSITLDPRPRTTLSLALEESTVMVRPGETILVEANLRLSVADYGAVKLRFNSSQRYNLIVRNELGDVVYNWAATAIFLPVTATEVVSGQREWHIEAQVPGLLPGSYQVEVYLTTNPDHQFAVSTPLQILPAN
jgi:hypothetical protein